jgi:ATP-dependent 26S proteasome regulatory subunit
LSVGYSQGKSRRGDPKKKMSNLADTDPMEINPDIKFENVGGLPEHIKSLKEMIVFPMMYSEVFEKFKITPPKGVLFHGPPGNKSFIWKNCFTIFLLFFRNGKNTIG